MAAPQSEGRSCVPECCSAAAGMVRPQGYQGDSGKTPGKARGDRCWYSYAGKEHYTKDFEIMRGQSLSRTVDGAEPRGKQLDKHGELWCAVANSYFGGRIQIKPKDGRSWHELSVMLYVARQFVLGPSRA